VPNALLSDSERPADDDEDEDDDVDVINDVVDRREVLVEKEANEDVDEKGKEMGTLERDALAGESGGSSEAAAAVPGAVASEAEVKGPGAAAAAAAVEAK